MHRLLLMLSIIRRNKALILSVAALTVFVVFAFMSFGQINEMKTEVIDYKTQIDALTEKTTDYEAIAKQNAELVLENDVLKNANAELSEDNKDLKTDNDELTAVNGELEGQNGELLEQIQSIDETEPMYQPEEKFKITFYSTDKSYEHLIPGKTVAMNSEQVADLGLKRGDEIYVKSQKGWSGYYKITDSGCAYGTIDIYVNRADIPSWGVEYDVEILI